MMARQFDLRVHVTGDTRHAPYVLAGLETLRAEGFVRIRWSARRPLWRDRVVHASDGIRRTDRPYPWVVLVDILDSPSGARGRFAVDLQDWREMSSREALTTSQVLFKRMHVEPHAGAFAREFDTAVLPSGLSHSVPTTRIQGSNRFRMARAFSKFESALNRPRRVVQRLGSEFRSRGSGSAKEEAEARAVSPDLEGPFAFFQVKYHPWEDSTEAARLNRERAELIRTLRSTLGPRFQGGMYFDGTPPSGFEDCQTELPTDREGYLAVASRASVVISTQGFGGSPPWKLCEYLQAGRCIVAETVPSALPDPLEQGVHVHWFESPIGCAKAAADLLESPPKRAMLEANARAYYMQHVAPRSAVVRFLRAAESVFASNGS